MKSIKFHQYSFLLILNNEIIGTIDFHQKLNGIIQRGYHKTFYSRRASLALSTDPNLLKTSAGRKYKAEKSQTK